MPPIKLRFSAPAAAAMLALLLTEVLIATIGRHIAWLRGFTGDVLAVVFVYFALKSALHVRPPLLACAALLVGLLVEVSQYLFKLNGWHIQNKVLRIIVGSTPDWWDVLAYCIGFGLILLGERLAAVRRNGRKTS